MNAWSVVTTSLLALALVYIVALLRSHADILRRLSILEDAGSRAGPEPDPTGVRPVRVAIDIAGASLSGDQVRLSLGAGSPATLLAFLSSGCTSCRPWWQELRDGVRTGELASRIVIVTHDRDQESLSRLRDLGATDLPLVMSSAAWRDYSIPASPHFVLCDGAGGVSGRGSAIGWAQLAEMITDARNDSREAEEPARTTGERAARAERALARAQIGPGHPSLYPAGRSPAPAGDPAPGQR